MIRKLRQLWREIRCVWAGGHDVLLATNDREMYLKCPSCGRRTPGWSVERFSPIERAQK